VESGIKQKVTAEQSRITEDRSLSAGLPGSIV